MVNIEITNVCNLQCSFCPEVVRPSLRMTPERFESALVAVLPKTERVTLHLMGEPLSHPEFSQIMEVCDRHQAPLQITTNGVAIKKQAELLLSSSSLLQINFSLQSYFDNFPQRDFLLYLNPILDFIEQALIEKPQLFINLRLWDLGAPSSQALHEKVMTALRERWTLPSDELTLQANKKSVRLVGRLYVHYDVRFDWPDINALVKKQVGTCHGARKQFGVHSDGTVVPCCFDKEAKIALGNIFEQDLQSILEAPRAQRLRQGFVENKLIEPLCQGCSYIDRFTLSPKLNR